MASVDEYGYIILDENSETVSNTGTGSSNRHSNTNSGGGHGFAIALGILFLITIIWFIVNGTNNQRDYSNSLNSDQSTSLTYSLNEGTTGAQQDDSDEYILPNSDSSYISYSDLVELSQTEVSLARNEIYARHGRRFKTDSIREYFETKTWYDPYIDPDYFSESVFNNYEKENIKTIVNYEKEKGWK